MGRNGYGIRKEKRGIGKGKEGRWEGKDRG